MNRQIPHTVTAGEWLKLQIERRGLSQGELAKRLGVDRSAVSRMIGGERRMRVEEIPVVAEYLNISPEEVMAAGAALLDQSARRDRVGQGVPAAPRIEVKDDGVLLNISRKVTLDQAARIIAILEEPAPHGA